MLYQYFKEPRSESTIKQETPIQATGIPRWGLENGPEWQKLGLYGTEEKVNAGVHGTATSR